MQTLLRLTKNTKMRKRLKVFKNAYAHLRIFLGNGVGFLNDFKYPVMIAIALKVYFPNADNVMLGLLALISVIILAFIGWIDLRYIQIAQRQAEIATEEYNPYFRRLGKRFK